MPFMLEQGKSSARYSVPPIPPSSLVSVYQSQSYYPSCLTLVFPIASPMAEFLLSTLAYSFQKIGLDAGVPWFQFPLLFCASDQAKGPFISISLDYFSLPSPYGINEIPILDGSVILLIIRVIPMCVRYVLDLMRGFPFM